MAFCQQRNGETAISISTEPYPEPRSQADTALPFILQKREYLAVYPDTIAFFIRRKLLTPLFNELVSENPDRVYRRKTRYFKHGKWITAGYVMQINQPTRRTLELLTHYKPSRFDFAYDFFDIDPTKLLLQKRRRTNDTIICEHSTYWAFEDKDRNIVSYSSRPSKVSGTDCSHIELRFKSPKSCKTAAFLQPFQTLTFGDLLRLDPIEVLTHQTKLAWIDLKKLDEVLVMKASKRRAQQRRPRYSLDQIKDHLHQLLLRAIHVNTVEEISSQQLWDFDRGGGGDRGFGRCLRKMSWSEVIDNAGVNRTILPATDTTYYASDLIERAS